MTSWRRRAARFAAAGSFARSYPPTRTVPQLAGMTPATQRSVVVFLALFGPTSCSHGVRSPRHFFGMLLGGGLALLRPRRQHGERAERRRAIRAARRGVGGLLLVALREKEGRRGREEGPQALPARGAVLSTNIGNPVAPLGTDRRAMAYRSLREFLDRLETAGELVRVKEPVDPVLEMAALADRAAKQGGPALLFENVKGRAPGGFPVAMNLFGTRRRTSWALSSDDFEEHARELARSCRWRRPSRSGTS